TDFTIVPTSAAATFEGSTSGAAPLSVAMPAAPPRAISATPMPTYKPVFDFLNRELMKACDEIGTPEVRYLAFSYQLSAISYQLSAISYQLSAISYQSDESRELKISVHVDSAEFRNDVPPPGG